MLQSANHLNASNAMSVFDFDDYKAYLSHRLSTQGVNRGLRTKLAKKLHCQSAFISQVLNSHTHFSLEHAVTIDEFLDHSPEESEYFLLLVHHNRAGSTSLKSYYRKKINDAQMSREIISERIPAKDKLTPKDAFRYYSSWFYSAIHVSCMIPQYQTITAIAAFLKLSPKLVKEAVEFLISCGLLEEKNDRLFPTSQRVHLGSESIMTPQYHNSWRLRLSQNIEQNKKEDIHYTLVLALSSQNIEKLKTVILDFIQNLEPIIQEGPEEELHVITLDQIRL